MLYYGFLDESGDIAPFTGSDFPVVAVLVTSRPRPIALHVKRAFRSISKRLEISEFKAARVPEAGIERLLTALVREDITVVAVVTDERGMVKLPDGPEEMFRRAAALALRHCTTRRPRLSLTIDKRYTRPVQLCRFVKWGEGGKEGLVGGLPLAVQLAGAYLAGHEENAADYRAWLESTPLAALDFGRRQRESVAVLMARSLERVSDDHAVLNAGRPHLLAVLADAYRRRDWETTLGFAWAPDDWLDRQGHWTDWVTILGQALDAARGLGDRSQEGAVLGSLGSAYWNLGQVEKAIEYYQQALTIAREIGDRRGEGNHLGNLGNAYYSLGQVEKAIEYYQQALAIAREIGDRRGEGNHLGNLGLAYRALGDTARARQHLSQALAIFDEIKSPYAEQARHWLAELD